MIKRIITIVAVVLIAAIGLVGYSLFKTPEAASGPIEAIPIDLNSDETEVVEAEVTTDTQSEPVSETETQVGPDMVAAASDTAAAEADTSTAGAADASVAEAPAEPVAVTETNTETGATTETGAEAEVTSSPLVFEIIPAESEARFLIDEVLRGDPITVVGATDQTAGQFAVDPNDLSTAQVGVIQINARTLATDNNFRNRAIKNFILLTDEHEFITFTPTEVSGLPESGAVGETYTFQVTGDLTITDKTQPATFNVTATPTSESRLEGIASTTLPYADFELSIPDVQSVDAVADEVRLELEFVAEAM